jgi:glycine C-acetyltransferase
MIDDAHGTGVLGAAGKGTAEDAGVVSEIDIHMGTFGKALGSFGAYVAASSEIVDLLVNRARSFVFSTSLPPSVPAASLAALEVVASSQGEFLRERLRANSLLFRTALQEAGFDTMGSSTHIVPFQVGDAETAVEFSRQLLEQGVFVQAIRPPTVPPGTSRLRCTLMAPHEAADLERAVDAIVRTARKLGVLRGKR